MGILSALWKEAGLEPLDERLAFSRAEGLDRPVTLEAAARRALDLLLEVEP